MEEVDIVSPMSDNIVPEVSLPDLQKVHEPPSSAVDTHLLSSSSDCVSQLPRDAFLSEYNKSLAGHVAMGSQLRVRLERGSEFLKERRASINALEKEAYDLRMLVEKEMSLKDKVKEQTSKSKARVEELSQQVISLGVEKEGLLNDAKRLQHSIAGAEVVKRDFDLFRSLEDQRVSLICAETDACLSALSVDMDQELFPVYHTTVAVKRWILRYGIRLAMLNAAQSGEVRSAFDNLIAAGIAHGRSLGMRHGVAHGLANRTLSKIAAYDPDAEAKFVAAGEALRDVKYPLADELEALVDAPIEIIMSKLELEGQGVDPNLHPSIDQLSVPIFPLVSEEEDMWRCMQELPLEDVVAASHKRAELKKKSRVVRRTFGVGAAHLARMGIMTKGVGEKPSPGEGSCSTIRRTLSCPAIIM